MINNLIVRQAKHQPIMLGMADRNEDELNQFNRKSLPDVLDAAFKGTSQAYAEAARPTADNVLPGINEHVIGQLMQMLMLATVVEGRLTGTNPYGKPGGGGVHEEHDDPAEGHPQPAQRRGGRPTQGEVSVVRSLREWDWPNRSM